VRGGAGWLSDSFFQTVSFARGADFMLPGLVFALAFSQLLLDFLAHQVDRRIQITLDILRKKIRPGQRNADRAAKLAFERFGLIVLEHYPNARRKRIQMLQLFDPAGQMVVNGLGQSDVVSRKNHIHGNSMLPVSKKSTGKLQITPRLKEVPHKLGHWHGIQTVGRFE